MNSAWYLLLIALLAGAGVLAWVLWQRRRRARPPPGARAVVFQGAIRAMREGLYPGLEQMLVDIPGLPEMEAPSTTRQVQRVPGVPAQGTDQAVDVTQFQSAVPGLAQAENAPESLLEQQEPEPIAVPEKKKLQLPPASIFREYDIRGLVKGELDPEHVKWIGLAIGTEIRRAGRSKALIGRDGRESSTSLSTALAKGMLSAGVDLINLGTVPTPVLYFAQHQQKLLDGVVVTASHNSLEYNGLKVVVGGLPLWGEQVRHLYQRIKDQDFDSGRGKLQGLNIFAKYLGAVAACFTPAEKSLKVVVDCANGMAGSYVPFLLRKLGHEIVELFCDTGEGPNQAPDPTVPANLQALRDRVRTEQADLGLAFDGDGDRIVVVDGHGEIIWPDRLLILFAEELLKRCPGATIVYDVKCTMHLAPRIRELGGNPIMWKTGHSLIRNKMEQDNALLAGELSGHLFFRDGWYGFDDAIYAGCRLLNLLSDIGKPPTEIFQELPGAFGSPEYRLQIDRQESEELIEQMTAAFQGKEAELIDIDGLRVQYKDRWGLLRLSNTSPQLIFRFEGSEAQSLQRIQEEFRSLLQQSRPQLKLPF